MKTHVKLIMDDVDGFYLREAYSKKKLLLQKSGEPDYAFGERCTKVADENGWTLDSHHHLTLDYPQELYGFRKVLLVFYSRGTKVVEVYYNSGPEGSTFCLSNHQKSPVFELSQEGKHGFYDVLQRGENEEDMRTELFESIRTQRLRSLLT